MVSTATATPSPWKGNVTQAEGEGNITVGGSANIILDLNGWNVEGSYNNGWGSGMVEVKPGANLTVKNTTGDESSGAEGKILNRGTVDKEGNTLYVDGGSATLESGTIAAEGHTSKSVLVCNGTFTMNGGTLNGGRQAGLGVMYSNGTATVNKGEIFGTVGAAAQQEGTLIVNGGTIMGTAESGVSSTHSSKLILNGGKVSAKEGSSDADIAIVHGANQVEIASGVEFKTLGISANSNDKSQSNTIIVDGKYQITYGGNREVVIKALDGSEVPPVLYDIAKKMVVEHGDQNPDGGYWEWIIIGPDAVNDPYNQIPDTNVGYKYKSDTEGKDLPGDFPAVKADAKPGDEVPGDGGKWVFNGWPDEVVEKDLYDVDGNPVEGVPAVPVFDKDGKHIDEVTVVGGWIFEADDDDDNNGGTPVRPVIPPVTDTTADTADATTGIDDEAVPLAGIFTRGDAIGYLWEQTGSPAAELSSFVDVPEEHQWAVAIGWAEANGIAYGNEDNEFRPDELVLRGELEEFLNFYARFAGAVDEGGSFITLDGEPDDVIFGEEAQEIFDDFFARLALALEQAA